MKPSAIDRTAAAINQLRPDWPVKSLRTLLESPALCDRPWPDVAVALTWVATDPVSRTPARVLEAGPWWRPELASEADQHPSAVRYTNLCDTCHKPDHAHPWAGCDTYRQHHHDNTPPPAWLGELRATLHDTPAKVAHSDPPATAGAIDRGTAANAAQARTALRSHA